MKLYIKNMVCDRCILVVSNLLHEFKLQPVSVQLGEIELGDTELSPDVIALLSDSLAALGFERINDKKSQLIESIKTLLIQLVQHSDGEARPKLSDYLSKSLHHDYHHLSHLFSGVEGITIEQYLINQKIEKTKELLVYDEQSLTEIAYRLGYSSAAHLSGQFKKVTGMSPSQFRQMRDTSQRRSLDKL